MKDFVIDVQYRLLVQAIDARAAVTLVPNFYAVTSSATNPVIRQPEMTDIVVKKVNAL